MFLSPMHIMLHPANQEILKSISDAHVWSRAVVTGSPTHLTISLFEFDEAEDIVISLVAQFKSNFNPYSAIKSASFSPLSEATELAYSGQFVMFDNWKEMSKRIIFPEAVTLRTSRDKLYFTPFVCEIASLVEPDYLDDVIVWKPITVYLEEKSGETKLIVPLKEDERFTLADLLAPSSHLFRLPQELPQELQIRMNQIIKGSSDNTRSISSESLNELAVLLATYGALK